MKRPDTRVRNVVFADEKVQEAFDLLKKGKSEDLELSRFLERAFDDLKADPFIGIKIPKALWPAEYVRKYGISNLWKYDLPNGWRLIYFVRGSEISIVSIILEWFDHKNYERRFGYRSG